MEAVDTAEPPRIVVSGIEACRPGNRVAALLGEGLAPAQPPTQGWVVALRIEQTTPTALRAEGAITDADRTPVARRVLVGTPRDCDTLARAIAMWASLVLETEASRARRQPDAAAPGGQAPAASDRVAVSSTAVSSTALAAEASSDFDRTVAGERELLDRSQPDHAPSSVRKGDLVRQFGVAGLLLAGPTQRAFGGASPYAMIKLTPDLSLRPSLAVARTLPARTTDADATWAAVRIDGCFTLTGRYAKDRGLNLDLCAGADAGFTYESSRALPAPAPSQLLPYASAGPSIDLGGEIGADLSLVLRGVTGLNLVPSGVSGRLELALAWSP